jgi:S1-C subfamily serine protease
VAIELPSAPGRRLTATVVAAPEEADVALLACDALDVEPLPLAKAMSSQPEVTAVERAADSWLAPRPTAVRGTVLTPVLEVQAKGRFVHTAVVPRGLGGGPIVDANGQVVGMVAPTPLTEASGNAAGFGVSVNKILNVVLEDSLDSTIKTDTIAGSNEGRAIAATLVVSAEPGQSNDER